MVKLGEVLDYQQPGKYIVKSKDYTDDGIPVLTAGQTFILGYTDENDDIFEASVQEPVIIFDDFTTSFHWVEFPFKVKSSAIKMLRPCRNDISFRYVYYAMQCIKYETTEHSRQWISKYSSIKIPLPPLEVQRAIADVLDKFSALEAELDCRKRQYEYYRERLLNFEQLPQLERKKIKFVRLGEIGTFTRGNGLQKKDFTETGVPCIHYGQIYTHYGTFATETITKCSPKLAKNLRKAKKGDLIITTTSENVEDVGKAVAWLGEEDVVIGGHECSFSHNENPKFISYLLQTQRFSDFKRKKSIGVKVIDLSHDKIADYTIPLPPPSRSRSG